MQTGIIILSLNASSIPLPPLGGDQVPNNADNDTTSAYRSSGHRTLFAGNYFHDSQTTKRSPSAHY
jgi:hypothetical protein